MAIFVRRDYGGLSAIRSGVFRMFPLEFDISNYLCYPDSPSLQLI